MVLTLGYKHWALYYCAFHSGFYTVMHTLIFRKTWIFSHSLLMCLIWLPQ